MTMELGAAAMHLDALNGFELKTVKGKVVCTVNLIHYKSSGKIRYSGSVVIDDSEVLFKLLACFERDAGLVANGRYTVGVFDPEGTRLWAIRHPRGDDPPFDFPEPEGIS